MAKQRKPYVLTPEDYFSHQERKTIMKTSEIHANDDLMRGNTTWPVRYMLVDLVMHTGLRVAEIAALKIEDINLQEPDPFLIVRNGKGGKKRTVYFDSSLLKHLRLFLEYKGRTLHQRTDPDAPLFLGRDGNHCPPITLMKSFKRAVYFSRVRQKLSIHSARHTYATFLLYDTGNLRYVKDQLGHSDIAMTSLYANILPEDKGHLAQMIVRDFDD
jgi:site-specific recombinase XerD